MLFSELYSVYYKTVGKIISKAFESDVDEKSLKKIIDDEAFSESGLTIMPSLKNGEWNLLDDNLHPRLANIPTMPQTTIEKRWLNSISNDPRIKLFGVEMPVLDDVEPLFTNDDFTIYDKYSDGDPYQDENYINNFRTVLGAIKLKRAIKVTLRNRRNGIVNIVLLPVGMEYSVKDDKIRIVGDKCRYRFINLARIVSCEYYDSELSCEQTPKAEEIELSVIINDERNALERAMLHFAHFEKKVERLNEKEYLLKLKYYAIDESEIVIRVLSFGQYLKVIEPQGFIELIKERLKKQKSCELS